MTFIMGVQVGLIMGLALGGLFAWVRWPRRNTLKERTLILHMRGVIPARAKTECQHSDCGRYSLFIDQHGVYYCDKHLPKDTVVAERITREWCENTKQKHCTVHGTDCPYAWELC